MNVGVVLVFVGFLLTLAGTLTTLSYFLMRFLKFAKKKESKMSGAIIIGPIPIIFGEDRKSLKLAIALALVGLVLMVLLAFLQFYFLR